MKKARVLRIFQAFAGAVFLLLVGVPSQAQTPGSEPVKTTLEARKVLRGADGRETFAPADFVGPGDVIEYAATYRNTTRETVRNLEATLPIPLHTEFLAGSARPAAVRASLDAREFAVPPLKRKTVTQGREAVEIIPYREYRFLRWQPVQLAGEASITFTARVRVLE